MLKKIVLTITSICISLTAAYLPENNFYSINKQSTFLGKEIYHNYKEYAKILLETGVFSKKELNDAINKDSKEGLSAFIRAVAYDRAKELKKAELNTALISKNSEEFSKLTEIIPIKLAIADLYLRQNKLKEISVLLPPEDFLGFEKSYSLQAQYYTGMAYYLETGKFNNYFLNAKNYFKPAKIIYYRKNKRVKGVEDYAEK